MGDGSLLYARATVLPATVWPLTVTFISLIVCSLGVFTTTAAELKDSAESITQGAPPSVPVEIKGFGGRGPAVDLDAFYSRVDLRDLEAFLGPALHFHHGLVSAEVDRMLGRYGNASRTSLTDKERADRGSTTLYAFSTPT